ncbi:MAG: sulfatase/phosphatase domain-containing protein, partial [Parvibaculaceae bacterium]
RIEALTSHIDQKPTFLDIAGAAFDGGDGVSLLPLLRGKKENVRDLLFAEYHPRVASEQYNQSVITRDARLTVYPLSPGWGEYFRHGDDPGEHQNLFKDPARQKEIKTLAAQLERRFPPKPEVPSVPIAVY